MPSQFPAAEQRAFHFVQREMLTVMSLFIELLAWLDRRKGPASSRRLPNPWDASQGGQWCSAPQAGRRPPQTAGSFMAGLLKP